MLEERFKECGRSLRNMINKGDREGLLGSFENFIEVGDG